MNDQNTKIAKAAINFLRERFTGIPIPSDKPSEIIRDTNICSAKTGEQINIRRPYRYVQAKDWKF